ncbi:MAG: hypothetical protein ACLVL7_15020 [Anaerotruncus massiliensis (ex Togo et al. 2019)]
MTILLWRARLCTKARAPGAQPAKRRNLSLVRGAADKVFWHTFFQKAGKVGKAEKGKNPPAAQRLSQILLARSPAPEQAPADCGPRFYEGCGPRTRALPSKKGKTHKGPCLFSHPPPFEKGGRKLLFAMRQSFCSRRSRLKFFAELFFKKAGAQPAKVFC